MNFKIVSQVVGNFGNQMRQSACALTSRLSLINEEQRTCRRSKPAIGLWSEMVAAVTLPPRTQPFVKTPQVSNRAVPIRDKGLGTLVIRPLDRRRERSFQP